ncbi:MAG: broad specificity phosphatase PhoE [Pseudohongiellaceae bacterium]|jgi:broad specificity phosphatase PhoE
MLVNPIVLRSGPLLTKFCEHGERGRVSYTRPRFISPGLPMSVMSDSSETHVRLVRHGEVAAAHHGTFYGGAEVPLSAAGQDASLRLATRLAEQDPPDWVASSPLSRALAVAEPLAAALGVEVRVDEGFRELDRGDWTHMHRDAVEAAYPGAIARYLADPDKGAAPGGETEAAFSRRVWGAMDRLVAAAAGRKVVLLSHGHVIRVILRRIQGIDPVQSLQHFVPYHGVVDTAMGPDGSGRLLTLPPSVIPEALR